MCLPPCLNFFRVSFAFWFLDTAGNGASSGLLLRRVQ